MPRSQNGYPANDVNRTAVRTIPGTSREVRLCKGEPGWLLLHLAAWFDKTIESVDGGILDDWGYAERTVRGSTDVLSNHASGTALDLNAPKHPLGVRNTFTPAQVAAIQEQLDRYEGAIRWGGDYTTRADEMHFEINAPRAFVRAAARRVRREDAEAKVALERLRARVLTRGPKVDQALKYAKQARRAAKAEQRRATLTEAIEALRTLPRRAQR